MCGLICTCLSDWYRCAHQRTCKLFAQVFQVWLVQWIVGLQQHPRIRMWGGCALCSLNLVCVCVCVQARVRMHDGVNALLVKDVFPDTTDVVLHFKIYFEDCHFFLECAFLNSSDSEDCSSYLWFLDQLLVKTWSGILCGICTCFSFFS